MARYDVPRRSGDRRFFHFVVMTASLVTLMLAGLAGEPAWTDRLGGAAAAVPDPFNLLEEPYRTLAKVSAAALLVLLVLRTVGRRISRFRRSRQPPKVHPKLAKYSIDHAALARARHEQAAAIVATSTGRRLAGYRIVRHVEAVFVEGLRTPDEAIDALKASAADRGANAVINVTHERTVGRCSASGDAVVVEPTCVTEPQPPPAP